MLVDEHFIGSSGPCRECRHNITIEQSPQSKTTTATEAYASKSEYAGNASDSGPLRIFAGLVAIVLSLLILAVVLERSRPSNITLTEQREAGLAAGETEGRKYQQKQAYKLAYRNEIAKRFHASEFTYLPIMAAVSFSLAMLTGFAIQYTLTFVARRIGLLTDIDAIVLGNIQSSETISLATSANPEGAPK
ncbi:MAG: hypothetical protein AAF497_10870 [Planctomycetota bacterium]